MWLGGERKKVAHEALADSAADTRAASDVTYEMLARFRFARQRATVMLKNLTAAGAIVEGLADLRHGDAITLLLPSLRPKEAVVVWLRGASAGLEFDRPLHPTIFATLIRDHARRLATGPIAAPAIDASLASRAA